MTVGRTSSSGEHEVFAPKYIFLKERLRLTCETIRLWFASPICAQLDGSYGRVTQVAIETPSDTVPIVAMI